MAENHSLGKDALQLTLSKMIVLVISMITGMLLSRFRSVEEYGTYSQIIMAITIATTIVMMGLPNSLNYFLAKADSDSERKHFLSVYYSSSTVLSLFVGLILVCLTPILVSYFKNPFISNFAYFLAIFPWTKIICASVENILVVYKKTKLITVYRILNSVALLGIILLVQLMRWSFGVYMLLYLLVEIIFSLWVYIIAYGCAGNISISFDFELIKKIFTFSIPLGLASMVGTLNVELDKFVIGGMMDTESLAIYTNASKEMPVTIVATSITAVLMPQMVKLIKNGQKTDAVRLWGDATEISFIIICFISFVLVVFAPEVITVLYSDKYIAGTSVFRVYSLILLLRCTYFGMILNTTGHTKFIFYSSLGSLALNFLLNYAFYFLFGFIGPAIASLTAQLLINLFQIIWSAKLIKIPFKNIFPWKSLLIILFLNSLIAGIFWALKNVFITGNILNDILVTAILGVLWFLTCFLLQIKRLKRKWNSIKSE